MGKLGFTIIIHKKEIDFKLKITCIWHLNPKAINNKTRPSEVSNLNNGRNEEDYIIKDETKIIFNGGRDLLL
jgi:hypothetical protein